MKTILSFTIALFFATVTSASWQATNGPVGGNIRAISILGSRVFTGTDGGVFVSDNNGTTWQESNSGLSVQAVNGFTKIGSNVFCSQWGAGISISNDNGASWSSVNTGITQLNNGYYTYSIYAHGTTLFAATYNAGVFKSTNNGSSWAAANSGISGNEIYCFGGDGTNLFAGTPAGVYYSSNSGSTWAAVNNGLTNTTVYALTMMGSNIYAATWGGGVFVSSNNGTSWSPINSGISNTSIRSITNDGTNLFAGSVGGGVYTSSNGGSTWATVNSGLSNTQVWALATNGTNLFAGTNNGGGIFHSTNNGNTWTEKNNGLTSVTVNCLSKIGSTILAGTNSGIYSSSNNGSSWSTINNGLTLINNATSIAVAGTNIFRGTNQGVYLSTNNGATWTTVNNGLTNTNVWALATDGTNVYAGTGGGGVFVTSNNGASWAAITNGLTNLNIVAIITDGTNLYAGANYGGVFLSTNNGTSWSPVNNGLTTNDVRSFEIIGSNVFVSTYGGVFRSSNNGSSWTSVSNGLPSNKYTWTLAKSGTNLFAGTENGIFVSIDNGASWSDVTSGLPYTDINSIVVNGNNVFVSKRGFSTASFNSSKVQVRLVSEMTTPPTPDELTVSGDLDFGTVLQGSTQDLPLFLYNNSSSVIHIYSISPSPPGVFNALMQNGDSILPYHSLPISIFFFPPGISNYNTTFTVVSDAPNGNVTFTAQGSGGNNTVSWIGFYNKPENNPEITSLEPLASNYITVQSVTPLKICADWSKSTIVKYVNNNSNVTTSNITFNMKSDPNGNNTDYTGWFITTDYTYTGDTVIAKYTSPKYLNISGLFRPDTIQVVNSANGNILYEHPAKIYRAPVILVHGLWGDMTSMLSMHSQLLNSSKYNSALLTCADYSTTNSEGFSQNSNVIKNEINSKLIELRILKYSAGKVDIVAHSMGGVLSRIYLQKNSCGGGITSNCYRNDIHKLITLNTPHSGTQLANFILSNAWGAGLSRTVLDYNGMPWNNGAVYDLQCNSPEIGSLNGANLNNHIVPSHAIETDRIPVTTYTSFDEEALANIIANARLESVSTFTNTVFASTASDLIVPLNSQQGGLTDYSYINDVKHTASPQNLSVANKVKVLLDANPTTSVYFDQNGTGFNPPAINPTFKTDETDLDPYDGQRSGTISIVNPSFGFTCSEGDVVPISVTASSNINHLVITASNINTGITSFDTLANSATVFFTVPSNIAGPIKIMALGYDNTGFVDLDTLEMIANPSATLDSLAFINDYVSIPVGQTVPFALYGYYSDSTVRNLNLLSNIVFDISHPNIASFSNHALHGLSVGTSVLHATYQGKNAYIIVNVYGGDDWVPTGIEETKSTKNGLANLVVYPNPTANKINVVFTLPQQAKVSFELHDLLGKKVIEINSKNYTIGNHIQEVDLSTLNDGVYICVLRANELCFTKKIIIAR